MTKVTVYAIYHPDSGLFYDGIGLSKLNAKTKFYNSEKNAKLADVNGFVITKITWDYLEKVYKLNRWNINIRKEKYNETVGMFKNLTIVPLNLEYRNGLE